MLADLILTDLPTEALVALKHAINDELRLRKKTAYIRRRESFIHTVSYRQTEQLPTYEQALEEMIQFNAQDYYALPADVIRSHYLDRPRYLPCLLAQDWTTLFSFADTTNPVFYVYAHLDPRKPVTDLPGLNTVLKGAPFYIGKGCDRRAWDLKRNQGHGKMIQQIRSAGFSESSMVQILAESLTEQAALALEAKLIYLFGSMYDETRNGCLVNLADSTKPSFIRGMHKLPKRRAWESKQQDATNQIKYP